MARAVVEDESLVKWLLDRGANPNLGFPKTEELPTILAVNAPTNQNSGRALNAAAAKGSVDVLDMLLHHGARLENSTPLHHVVAAQRPFGEKAQMMARLLELGVDVNGTDELDGREGLGTSLHHAARWNRADEAKFLIERGAEPNKPDVYGRSALDEASRYPQTHQEVIKVLQGAGGHTGEEARTAWNSSLKT